jgi:hypothetical protein
MIEDTAPGVKSKASTEFIERIAKLPAQEGLSEQRLLSSFFGFFCFCFCFVFGVLLGQTLQAPGYSSLIGEHLIFFLQGLKELFPSSPFWALRLITYLKFNPLFM